MPVTSLVTIELTPKFKSQRGREYVRAARVW
jgi:hypothetical protein